MADSIVKARKLTDISDETKKVNILRGLISKIQDSITTFQNAYHDRREELVEINALYRNQSWVNKNKANWQTKAFIPLFYNAVERKTSVIHESFWGNRIASPFTVIGKTPEDHTYAFSAETVLNNIMDSVGFYETSEEAIRSCVKYGLGVYRYGWKNCQEEYLWRETVKDSKGKVQRKADGSPILRYIKKKVIFSQPFVRNVDIINNIGWDPTAKKFSKDCCDYVYEIREESAESIREKELRGEYDPGVSDKLTNLDPHGITAWNVDDKTPQLRQDDAQTEDVQPKTRYSVVDWYGWFDINGDGFREFVKIVVLENRLVLSAEENLMNEYPFLDIQYSRSLHTLTPWGVVDPVVSLQLLVNEMVCQRGDAAKLKLNPQWSINVDTILEDHSYVSTPGAMHPFALGVDGDIRKAMVPVQFDNPEFISFNEQDRLIGEFEKATGVADFNQVLNSSNKNTPASTIFGILNEQQSGNSMIVNGILNRHGVLGSRILKLIQLFGDSKLILRSAGRRGFDFHTESIENILGDFDVKVTTSSFFGNRQIELQHLIQLKPLWAQAPHIDQVELDKAILENILPKRVEKIIKTPLDPLSPMEEQLLFIAGQGESVELSELETLPDLTTKLRIHQSFEGSSVFMKLDDQTREEWDRHMERIRSKIEELNLQRQALAQQAGQNGQAPQAVNGNLGNTGLPEVRTLGNQLNPVQQQ